MKKIFILLLFMMNISVLSSDDFKFIGKLIDFKLNDKVLTIKAENSNIEISILFDNIIRLRYTNKEKFETKRSYAIEQSFELLTPELKNLPDELILSTKELEIKIKKNPVRISFFSKDGKLINADDESFGVAFDNDEVRSFKKLFDDEKFYGLGEKTGELNRRGKQFVLWNTDHPAFDWNWDPVYVSIPFFIGIKEKLAYGIFFDNTYKSTFNFGASSNRFFWFGAEKGEMDYYFIYGPDVKKVVLSYSELTGKIELPPKWALGFQQSKWSYYPDSEVIDIAKKFRRKNIPLDVIYLDIHYMNEYRVFSWDKNRFPEPKKTLAELKDLGIKIIPIIDPGVKADKNYEVTIKGIEKDVFAKYPDGSLYQGEVWPSWSYFPDFTKKEGREFWGENIKNMIDVGCAGFWNDMNEPAVWGQNFPDIVQFDDYGFKSNHKKIHNVYALEMAKANFEAFNKYFPNKRFFTLSRAGFSGIQKYAANWTGDNVANEEHLRLANLMCQGMSLSGQPFIGSDVGGFIGVPSSRLYIRWMQLGVFTPFFRAHSAVNQSDKEPWSFGDETEHIVRHIIELRYQLIPYLYNEFYNTTITGLPIIRPMIMENQNDDNSYNWDNQYQFFFGENILVSPVMSENENTKRIYLPEGKWYDFNKKAVIDGGKSFLADVPLYQIPFFIKDGSAVPFGEKQLFVGEKKEEKLTFYIFSEDKEVNYKFYFDDGETKDYRKGSFSQIQILSENMKKGKKVLIKILKNDFAFNHKISVVFVNTNKPEEILINNKKCDNYSFNSELKELKIDVELSGKENEILFK